MSSSRRGWQALLILVLKYNMLFRLRVGSGVTDVMSLGHSMEELRNLSRKILLSQIRLYIFIGKSSATVPNGEPIKDLSPSI